MDFTSWEVVTVSRFYYAAKDAGGRLIRGRAEADDDRQLFERLRTEGLYPVRIRRLARLENGEPATKRQLADFCTQLGNMLEAGLPLDAGLEILAAQEETGKMAGLCKELLVRVRQGCFLSAAMEACGGVFPPVLVHVARAGESGGSLGIPLLEMGKRFDQEEKLAQKIRLASLYPCLLFAFTAAMVVVIFGFVMPSFYELFEGMEVPVYTRVLINVSRAVKKGRGLMPAALFLLLLALWGLGRWPPARLRIDRWKVRSRLWGPFGRKVSAARFTSAMAPLYGAGLSMVDCLHLCQGCMENSYMDEQLRIMEAAVENGVPLSKAVGDAAGFDRRLKAGILVGEESGRLGEMLYNSSILFQEETDRDMQKLIVLLEPVMILIMAVIIGYVAVSVMAPIYQYYQSIG